MYCKYLVALCGVPGHSGPQTFYVVGPPFSLERNTLRIIYQCRNHVTYVRHGTLLDATVNPCPELRCLRIEKKANAKRASIGRGKFRCGPRVVDSSITEVIFEHRDALEDHISDDENDELAPVLVDGVAGEKTSMPLSGKAIQRDLSGASATHDVPIHGSQDVSMEFSSSPDLGQESVPLDTHESEPDLSSDTVSTFRGTDHDATENEVSEPSDEDLDPFSDDISVLIVEIDTYLPIAQVGSTNTSVLEWVKHNQNWVDLFNTHGIKITVMDAVLKNLKAPVKCWKTVIANICKEASLKSHLQVFATYPRHMCYADLSNLPESNLCSGFGSPKPDITATTSVHYIPLLPRIHSMLLEEHSCKSLFQYHQTFQTVFATYFDYFDGESYHRLCQVYGGSEAVSWDIFISASTDGFQAYKNRTLDVWPVVAILLNLPLAQRYSVKNVLPLMFIPHGRQPSNLQSFLIPLINEVKSTFPDGLMMRFYDGSQRRVRLHLVWFSADLDRLRKVASLTGHNGKTPCRFCDIQGVYCAASRQYYFPCMIHLPNGQRRSTRYNPRTLPLRTSQSIKSAMMRLNGAETISARNEVSKETGIKGESILFQVPNFVPYRSFPIDIMLLFYDVQKHLLSNHTSNIDDNFCLSSREIEVLDSELLALGDGISGQLAPTRRQLSTFQTWKAAEHKHFTLSYYMILFDGYLPRIYMDGLEMYVKIVEFCFRPVLTDYDFGHLAKLSAGFNRSFEKHFMRHHPDGLKMSTYVMHLLLHLAEGVRENGPLLNTSQYWVERYIGWIVDRLSAKRLPAASFRNSALFTESYKMLFSSPFSADDTDDDVSATDGFKLSTMIGVSEIDSVRQGLDLKRLLIQYMIRKYEGMTVREAQAISNDNHVCRFWGRVRFRRNGTHEMQTASAFSNYTRGRRSCYLAAEMDEAEYNAEVYYGQLLQLLELDLTIPESYITSALPDTEVKHCLAVIKWAKSICEGKQHQVFVKGNRDEAFSSSTLEDISIIKRLIGVVEHAVPSVGKEKRGRNQRSQQTTYFIDSDLRKESLLSSQRFSIDGVNRVLKGFAGRR